MSKTKTIVLIHGNFVNNATWSKWKQHYEQRGYTVFAPPNPGHEGIPAELRAKVHPQLAQTGFIDIVQHLSDMIDKLGEKPLIIGHSMAGMAVQKLVELGKAVAGVSIDGAPPKNIFPPVSTLKVVWPALGILSGKNYFLGSRAWYDKAFFNTLPGKDRSAAYDAFAVPESLKVSWQLVTKSFSNVDFRKPHVPLLFIGGGSDHIFPPSLTRKIAGSYKDAGSSVDLKIFENKSHFICGEPGWEAVADYILDWYASL